MNRKSTEARELAAERRVQDKIRTIERHVSRSAKYSPTRGAAGAW